MSDIETAEITGNARNTDGVSPTAFSFDAGVALGTALMYVSDAVPTADVDGGSAQADDGGNAVVAETGKTLNLLKLLMKAGVVKQRCNKFSVFIIVAELETRTADGHTHQCQICAGTIK